MSVEVQTPIIDAIGGALICYLKPMIIVVMITTAPRVGYALFKDSSCIPCIYLCYQNGLIELLVVIGSTCPMMMYFGIPVTNWVSSLLMICL